MGKHTIHEENNDNGNRSVNFATSTDIVIRITLFPHKKVDQVTWR